MSLDECAEDLLRKMEARWLETSRLRSRIEDLEAQIASLKLDLEAFKSVMKERRLRKQLGMEAKP